MDKYLLHQLPQTIQNNIAEYNCEHRSQMKVVFEEVYWRSKYTEIMKSLPERISCKFCLCRKPVICCNVNFCGANCNRIFDGEDDFKDGYTHYDYGDEFSSANFQYPGFGKKPGFIKRTIRFLKSGDCYYL